MHIDIHSHTYARYRYSEFDGYRSQFAYYIVHVHYTFIHTIYFKCGIFYVAKIMTVVKNVATYI